MEPPETAEFNSKLYKTEEERQIFLVFSKLKQEQKEANNQGKIFLEFLNTKPKIKQLSKLILNTKDISEQKQRKYFWSFCVLESGNKQQTTKRKKRKSKYGYTKYRQDMICK